MRLIPSSSPSSLSEGSFPPAAVSPCLSHRSSFSFAFSTVEDFQSLFNPFGLNQMTHLTLLQKESNSSDKL
jgi:hypothetical protein